MVLRMPTCHIFRLPINFVGIFDCSNSYISSCKGSVLELTGYLTPYFPSSCVHKFTGWWTTTMLKLSFFLPQMQKPAPDPRRWATVTPEWQMLLLFLIPITQHISNITALFCLSSQELGDNISLRMFLSVTLGHYISNYGTIKRWRFLKIKKI